MRRRTKYTINQPVDPLTLIPVIEPWGDDGEHGGDLLVRAAHWAREGASWLHIALPDASGTALGWLPRLNDAMASAGAAVQLDAPWAAPSEIDHALAGGVCRVVVGMGMRHAADLLREAVTRHGVERFVVAVSDLEQVELLKTLGVERLLVRVERDAGGPRIAALGELAQKSGLPVIADIDIHTLEELRRLRWVQPFGVDGVLLGQALHSGRFTLDEAAATLEETLPSDARAR